MGGGVPLREGDMILAASLLLVSPSIFAQYERRGDKSWELRVYELPSQRVLTILRTFGDEEVPFAMSPDGQIAVSDYKGVHHWSRKSGWRRVDHFGLMLYEGNWTFGENSAANSGQFSPDGRYFLFRVYPTMGASDMNSAAITVFRVSDLRRWVPEVNTTTARWETSRKIVYDAIWFEEDATGNVVERNKPGSVMLPTRERDWIAVPRETTR